MAFMEPQHKKEKETILKSVLICFLLLIILITRAHDSIEKI